jgi:SAM-dependent methyltransferase
VLAAALRHRPDGFEFDGVSYRYFAHPYNETWRNERAVEIPVAMRTLEQRGGSRVLEVGNVLVHYGRAGHDVVDKYERASNRVVQADIVDFRTSARYDLIVAISTLEHVGFDEDVKDPAKPRRAVEHMTSLLAPGGELLVTIPLGYNAAVDRDLETGALGFDEVGYLRRLDRFNRWSEASASAVAGAAYGHPFAAANALAVARRRAVPRPTSQ